MIHRFLLGKNILKKTNKKSVGALAKSRFIQACTEAFGALYRPCGTVVKNLDKSDNGNGERRMNLANLAQRTHHRVRYLESNRQINIENITVQVEKLLGDKPSVRLANADWVNFFFHHAQDISDGAMQALWAKAMAMEILQPGSISKRSLLFLYSCDQWEIAAFKKISAFAFLSANGHPFIFRSTEDFYVDDPIFTERRMLAQCVSAGLVTQQVQKLCVGFGFDYLGRRREIKKTLAPGSRGTNYVVQHFSKVGSDLYRILITAEASLKHGIRQHVVWDVLSDFLEIDDHAAKDVATA